MSTKPLKIVVLDGHTLNPGDLSWDALRTIGACEIHPRTSAEEVISRASEADIILVNKTVLDGSVIRQLDRLKYIGVLATGYNVVDLEAAAERNIPVTNVPEYGSHSVAQMVFAHIQHFYNHVAAQNDDVKAGKWNRSRDWCYWEKPLIELYGKTLGIIGFGKIGRVVAQVGQAYGMNILAHSRTYPDEPLTGVSITSLDEVFQLSDIVSLHCPLTDDNRNFVNRDLIGSMKQNAILINTSRGPLINEVDLANALNRGIIAGAGLDVLSDEPPEADNPLLDARNCVITPHVAWATQAARERLMATAIENIRAYLNGVPINCVS